MLKFSLFICNALLAAGSSNSRIMRGEQLSAVHKSSLAAVGAHQHAQRQRDYCADNYFIGITYKTGSGISNTALCPEGSAGIVALAECQHAAEVLQVRAGRPDESLHFEKTQNDGFEQWPQGCFLDNFDAGTAYYNEITEASETNPVNGTPICARPKYKNATADKNAGDEGGGCATEADDYEPILIEDECRTFAECKGYCVAEEFRTGVAATNTGSASNDDEREVDHDATSFDKFPEGCFIKTTNPEDNTASDGCVYFNVPKIQTTAAAAAKPSGPKGVGVCKARAGHYATEQNPNGGTGGGAEGGAEGEPAEGAGGGAGGL